ncbi:MAG: polysaccharide deacetylase family protein [Bacteroidales bacterium]|nr:polysaccharide deacetylase family protein [Bacteroidales bacterium]
MKSICFYFQVHQPFRLKTYRFFNMGHDHYYYNDFENSHIMSRVAQKSYLPMNDLLLKLIKKHGKDFKVSFSITGHALEQFEAYAPEVIQSFKKLAETGNVEFLAETYAHSLSSLRSKTEFAEQVELHSKKIESLFGVKPTTFRNTELIYSDEIGEMVHDMGYTLMLTEGAKHVLGWKSSNFMYCNARNPKLKVLLKNHTLSDDIAFRFSNHGWSEWPLTADKFTDWLLDLNKNEDVINLFMDYETFGEHQWRETGIFDFMASLPAKVLKTKKFKFATPSELEKELQPISAIHVPYPISWADEERDITAWLGNEMQDEAFSKLYALESRIKGCNDPEIMSDWYRLQNSDHFYYMCTKWFSDGDVHKYFNPYNSPYEAFINYMNVLSDFTIRVEEKCGKSGGEKIIEKAGELGKEISDVTRKAVKATTKKVQEVVASAKTESVNLDHIKDLSNAKVKSLLKEIDAQNLLYALKDATDEVRDKVLPNLTKSAKAEYDRLAGEIKKINKNDIAESRKKIAEKISKFLS